MKDHLIAILEAMRLSQATLALHHVEPGTHGAEATLGELAKLLSDKHVTTAMDALYPNVASPPIGGLPEQGAHPERGNVVSTH